ncbi:right-handed parallel beta-helix repeat-containing protein, partial [bacterium]|nr:right-handed parallel beta-helix repeat-containing protein [bacterium]
MGTRAFVTLALCALIVGAWATGASATDIYVPADHTTIQAAIDAAASSGDVIYVAAGTYREQLKIDGKSLDLVGAGIGSTIVEAVDVGSRTIYNITQWTGSARPIDACIGVVGPATVNISDLTVDGRELGPNNFYGIHFFDTSGSVTGCRIEDILYAADPGQSKVVSLVATHSVEVASYAIDFSGNVIPNFQKGGVLLMGPYLTFTVDDNEITNVPSTIIAGNGIQLSYGATGTTSGNIVHGVGYAGDDWSATGILLFESGDISMDGDVVHACESGVNYSNWGWIYTHPSVVGLSVADLVLYDNEWTLSAQLSCDNADLNFAADGCVILDSTGDGIELYGTDLDPWGGAYYMGWDNGDLVADITNCVITGTALDGIWIDDWSGNATNTMDIEVHYTAMEGNVGSGLWNSSGYGVNAEYCWWGDPAGPTVVAAARDMRPAVPPVSPYGGELPEQGEVRYAESSSSRAGDGVHGLVDYDPWLTGNIVCDPDPEYLTAAASTKTIAVKYLGGGSGAVFGYSVKFSWDSSVVGTTIGDVNEGNLLSDLGGTFFYAADGTGDEIIVDCALLGSMVG